MNPKATPWTLDGELCKLSRKETVGEALVALGIVAALNENLTVRPASTWYRAGAETYLLKFEVSRPGQPQTNLVMKACTPSVSLRNSIQKSLQEWVERRRLLQARGIAVPHLYYWGEGIIIEEYIPYPLIDILRSRDKKSGLLLGLTHLGAALSALGFHNRVPFSDLRSRGHDVVMIDFGSDLGYPETVTSGDIDYFDQLSKWCQAQSLELDSPTSRALRNLYEKERNTAR